MILNIPMTSHAYFLIVVAQVVEVGRRTSLPAKLEVVEQIPLATAEIIKVVKSEPPISLI